ncbi:MAG: L,D-transpeptidase [Actinomycetota bacterium]|nr:MAG: L,D-transpeptidase [Actinomycetota bacterium]
MGQAGRTVVRVRAVAAGAAAVAAIVAVSACGPALRLSTSPSGTQSSATIDAPVLGQTDVAVDEPVVLTAEDGWLTSVSVTGPKGVVVAGAISEDGATWTSASTSLAFGTTYRVKADAVDSRGVPTTTQSEFTTLTPTRLLRVASVTPAADAVVGVGMPITVTLDRAVAGQAARAAVERNLIVTSSVPAAPGAWSWQSDTVLQYRPQTYWPANSTILVAANLRGVRLGNSDNYGAKDETYTFRTADAMIINVDAAKHRMTVQVNGKTVRTAGITTGKSGFETRSGIKVIMTREVSRVMDAASGGTDHSDPEYYRVTAPYAMRITNSGEFLHGAPWSTGSQGSANVSHGCVGMSVTNAKWLYDNTHLGDVVVVTGTSRQQDLGNGITVWNESWADWLKGSALASSH